MVRSALAGVAAAGVWAAAEPLLQRAFDTPYSDVRLLGGLVTNGGAWRPIGVGMHLGNGALFGMAFKRLGGRGLLQSVLAAELENLLLWPAMALFDRLHPDRRSGVWPPLLTNQRVFVYEATVHAIFGFTLGVAMSD
jgi:hypothetical protein